MASNDVNDEVFKSKRIPKTPIKFKIQLNEEQKLAKEKILNNSITLLAGGAGSGKTLLACNVALDLLLKKTFKKIHDVVEKGSKDIDSLVKKAESFVEQSEELIRSSDNSIKIIAGFVIFTMGLQMMVSYTQFRVNVKMLSIMNGMKK